MTAVNAWCKAELHVHFVWAGETLKDCRGAVDTNNNEKEKMPMKKLFTGKLRGVPAAALAVVLLTVLIAGGVVAATSGYVLWEGTSTITVDEPISIFYDDYLTTPGVCDVALILDVNMPYMWLWPGVCVDTWFKITSASPNNLLIKADVITSNDSVVTVDFYNAMGGPCTIDDAGLVISSGDGSVFCRRSVCVAGNATPNVYTMSTVFTRESPPPAP